MRKGGVLTRYTVANSLRPSIGDSKMALKYSKLNRDNLRRLAPGARLTERGITFARLETGDGVYSVNIMVDRVRIHRVIGRESEGVTRTQCEVFIEAARSAAREQRLSLPKRRKVALSFREASEHYIQRLRAEGGKGVERKARQLQLHLLPFFGEKPLSTIDTHEVGKYKNARLGHGASEATVNRELAVLSHLFSKGMDWGWLTARPAKIERFREGNGRIVYLTTEQCQRVLEAAKHDISPHIYAYSFIALSTAMRMSEILGMRTGDVDHARRRIFIPRAKGGPGSSRSRLSWLNS